MVAAWSLLAVDPTHEFLTLACTGFAVFLPPWVGGFGRDNAAWTAWPGWGCDRRSNHDRDFYFAVVSALAPGQLGIVAAPA